MKKLSYRIGTGNFNFDNFDNTSVYRHVNRDINMKLCVKSCGEEKGEPLGHVEKQQTTFPCTYNMSEGRRLV